MKHGLKYKIGSFLTVNFYLIYALSAYLSFKYNVPGFFRQVLWLLIILVNYRKLFRGGGMTNNLVFWYCIFGVMSITGMVQHPYPFEFFYTVFFESYIPIIFFFIGCNERSTYPVFYQRCVYAFSFIFIAGIYWLITTPAWYVTKQLEVLSLHSHYTEDTLKYARFASFLDSYHTANYGVFLLCFSLGGLYYFMKDKKKKILFIITGVLSIVSILLSQQRVAMFMSVVIIGIYLHTMNKFNSRKALTLFILAVVLVFYYLTKVDTSDYVSTETIFERFSSSSNSTMVSDRSSTWIYALEHQRNFIFGHGVGGGGHLAHAHHITPTVRDGSYFKVLLETGIISLVLFITIIISSLIKGWKNKKKYLVEFLILFYCSFSLIGANIIDFPYIIAIMWYVIGRLSSNKKYANYESIS